MARPKKSNLSEEDVAAATPEVVLPVILPVENTEAATPQPLVEPQVEEPKAEEPEEVILPEADRIEMDRCFRVINTSSQASRISQAISHQRELQMWGVHQYDDNRSRNSYARSFYFKDRENALKALARVNKLLE
jgi:hypothetical protein